MGFYIENPKLVLGVVTPRQFRELTPSVPRSDTGRSAAVGPHGRTEEVFASDRDAIGSLSVSITHFPSGRFRSVDTARRCSVAFRSSRTRSCHSCRTPRRRRARHGPALLPLVADLVETRLAVLSVRNRETGALSRPVVRAVVRRAKAIGEVRVDELDIGLSAPRAATSIGFAGQLATPRL